MYVYTYLCIPKISKIMGKMAFFITRSSSNKPNPFTIAFYFNILFTLLFSCLLNTKNQLSVILFENSGDIAYEHNAESLHYGMFAPDSLNYFSLLCM